MQPNLRPSSSAARSVQRPVQYGRSSPPGERTVHSAAVAPPPNTVQTAAPQSAAAEVHKEYTLNLQWHRPQLPKFLRLRSNRLLQAAISAARRVGAHLKSFRVRLSLGVIVMVVLASVIVPMFQPYLTAHTYAMGVSEAVLESKDTQLAKALKHNTKDASFDFNAGYSPSADAGTTSQGGPKISAIAYEDPAKGLEVTDPINNVSFTIKPQFKLWPGKQDGNRIVYPLMNGTGWVVYTMQAGGVKEDVVLRHANGDTMELQYKLDMSAAGLAAHLETDGSVGIYGSSLPITGHVTTGSDKDAKLLEKARQNAKKDKFLFALPAPTIYQTGHRLSSAKAHYELKGDILNTVTTGLDTATFPLTVDPAVTVTSTSSLFRDTTPESNVDFNATTGNISRGAVTGGVLPAWTTNPNSLGTSRFAQSATVYDDYVYVAGGIPQGSTTVPTASVEFAKIGSGSPTIGAWSATTSLPLGIARFQLQAYNGYLYAIGGATVNNLCDTVVNTIYYTRIQANGQLSSSWNTNATGLPTGVCSFGATAYNGKLYVAGGQLTKQFSSAISTVAYASFNPDGSVTSFTTSPVALPVALSGADLRAYNGYLYFFGGATGGGGGGTQNNVYYAPIASDGSIYGTSSANWINTSSFNIARSNLGSSFTFAYDGFMYLVGGCGSFNASFNCSAPQQDTQIAQINADGSLGTWSNDTQALLPSAAVGESIISWRGNVYSVAGCTTTASGVTCTAALATQLYSAISAAGQVGPLNTPTNALPTAVYEHGAAINNGYIYVVGGCKTVNATTGCQTGTNDTTGSTMYAPLNADGTIGTWITDSTRLLNGTALGLSAFGLVAYNNYLYVTGGYVYGTGATRSVNYVQLASGGGLAGNWTTVTNALPAAWYSMGTVVHRGYLISFGGCSATTTTFGCTTYNNQIYESAINLSTGAPGAFSTLGTTLTATNQPTALMGATVYNGYVYLAGGANAATGQTTGVYYASLSSTGAVGTFAKTTGVMTHALRRADTYALNGYLYVTGGHDGGTNTTYGSIQIGKITLSTGDIASNFTESVTTITPRWDARAAYANGYLYVTGGCSAGNPPAGCTTASASDEYVENYNAGNKNTSAWTTAANTYTTNRVMAGATAYNGYIYVAGGCKTSFTVAAFSGGCSGNQENTVYYAALNPDGTIGTWANAVGYNLPAARSGGCLVTVGGYLYYMGGQGTTNTAVSTVYYNQIGAAGLPGTWNTATKGLGDTGAGGQARLNVGCDVFSGYVYVTGGLDVTATPAAQTTVYHTPSLAAGGNITANWTSSTAFTTARENHSAIAAGGYLYVLGGDDKTTALLDVQYIKLNPSTGDTTGSWGYTSDLPQPVSNQGSFVANGYIYLTGGRTAAGSCINTTVVAAINSTGTLGAWSTNATTAANKLATARFGVGMAYYNGYYYALGGHDCTNIISANVIQQGGQRSQSMKATFSKYADLNGDGQPEKLVIYLTNAQNSGVDIEQWSMTYKSSREAANAWGAVTTVSPLLNQNAYNVTALDASSVNQVVSRWFSLTFTINMEQSFTFTDDTQPTIYQYGLHYAPPPSKRLLHGRDFRDQNQQGLDLKLGI